MKRSLQLAKGERLCDWIDRIIDNVHAMNKTDLKDALTEISKQSYIQGSNDCQMFLIKRNKRK